MDAILTAIEPALPSAVSKAMATLTAILDDAAAPAAQKIRAACTILRISMAWPKHRDALMADVTPPARAASAPKPATPSNTIRSADQPTPSDLAGCLQSLSDLRFEPPSQISRTASLLGSAGAAPLTAGLIPLTRITPVTFPLARTG